MNINCAEFVENIGINLNGFLKMLKEAKSIEDVKLISEKTMGFIDGINVAINAMPSGEYLDASNDIAEWLAEKEEDIKMKIRCLENEYKRSSNNSAYTPWNTLQTSGTDYTKKVYKEKTDC